MAARNKNVLTSESVLKLPAPEKGQREYFDLDRRSNPITPGFALRVSATGVRSYVLHYRPRGGPYKGKLRRMVLGRVGELTLAEARESARNYRAEIRDKGTDPLEEKSRAKQAEALAAAERRETYKQAVEDYVRKYQEGKKGNRTAGEIKRVLLKEGSKWHNRPVGEISRADVHDVLDSLMAAGKPYLANRTLAYLRTFFGWCVRRDKIPHSPVEGVERPFDGEKPRERHFSDTEIKTLWKTADRIGGSRGAFLKIALLTGKRRGEIAGMTWDELNLRRKREATWTLPAARSKNGRDHKMPLPPLAVRILKGQPKIEDNPLVFPGRKDKRPMSGWSQFQKDIQDKSKIADFTFHACRHTLKTRLGELGVPPHVKDKVLHHAPPRTAGEGYDHYDYLAEQRKALEAWAEYVERLVYPKGVVALHG